MCFIFFTYKIPPGIYTVNDISDVVNTKGDYEGTIQSEYDDISLKLKLIFTPFGFTFVVLRFD